MADVYIKNIPLSYLKKQSKGFFSSSVFNKAVEVFDKYKQPLSPNEVGESLDKQILPMDMLYKLLENKYAGVDYTPETQADKEDFIFIGMSGKVNKKTLFKPRRYVTRCTSEFKAIDNCYLTMYNANTLYNSRKSHSNTPTLDLDHSVLKALAKPANTTNVLGDITGKAKFYESIDNHNVYDDVLYKEELLARLYNLELIVSKLTLPAAVLKRKVDIQYPTMLKDESKACEDLATELIEKYKCEYSSKYTTEDVVSLEDKITANRKIIESILASRTRDLPVSVYMGSGFSNVVNTITHGMNSTEFRVLAINIITGKEVTKDCTVVATNKSSMTIRYTGSDPSVFGMSVCLLFSNRPKLNVHTTYLTSFQEEADKTIVYKFNKPIVNHKCAIDIQLFNVLYGFYEIRSGGVLVTPIDVQTDDNSIEFTFENKLEGKVDILIMPNNSILRGVSKTKISEAKVLDVINGTNLYDDRISIWRELE